MNARGIVQLGALTFGIAAAVALAPDLVGSDDLDIHSSSLGYDLSPVTNSVANNAPSSENIVPTSTYSGGFAVDSLTAGAAVHAPQGGCERLRRPNCNRPGRRSTHR
jgi:hypothetical protein